MNPDIFEKLLDISLQLSETRELDPLLTCAMGIALELTEAEYGYLVLIGQDDTLDFRVKRNIAGYTLTDEEVEISHSIIEETIISRKPVMTANASTDPAYQKAKSVRALQLRSVLCIPLIAREQAIGALYMENRSHASMFDEENLRQLRFFASQAAVAIQNALLNDELEARVIRRTAELQEANERLSAEMAERRRIEEELVQRAIERERMEVLTNFIQDASHQFRTPLAVINTNVDLLNRKIDTDMHGKHLKMIREQGQVILQLVTSLVMMARLDSNAELDWETVDLNVILNEVQHELAPEAQLKNQQIQIATDSDEITIGGDPKQIAQALSHIINNAIQFTPEDGTIYVRSGQAGDQAIIEIVDHGEGIPEEDIPLIFTRFFRGDKAGTTRGLGLGLAIAEKIMKIHRGRIEVESRREEGSTFRLIFPLDLQ